MDLINLLRQLTGDAPEMEPVGPLSPELDADMKTITKEREAARYTMRQIDAAAALLWTKIEKEVGIYDRKLDYRQGTIFVEKNYRVERKPE